MWRHGGRVDPRDLLVLLLLSLSACAANDMPPPAGFGGVRTESALTTRATGPDERTQPPVVEAAAADAAGHAASAVDADVDTKQLERTLRDQLATAADPTQAALELADLLAALERHREALAVVATALQRVDAPALQVCRAGLLRDLGRPRQAAAALLALVQNHGPGAMHPGLLFECAELQWLVGDGAGAAATLQELRTVHAADPWCDTNRAALDGLAAEVANHAGAPRARVRDLLASLRGADAAPDRIRLLGDLVDLADRETGERRHYLRTRALAIACADTSPAVRSRAVQLAEVTEPNGAAFVAAALADEAPLVRRFAAERTAELPPADAIALLVEAIDQEDDAGAFLAMHTTLSRLVANGPTLAPREESEANARARVAAAWGQRCSP